MAALLLFWLAGCTLPPSSPAPPKHGPPLTVTLYNEDGDDPQFVYYAAYPVTGQGKIDDAVAAYPQGVIAEFLKLDVPSAQPATPADYIGVRPELDLLGVVTANTGAAFGVMFDQATYAGAPFLDHLHNSVFAVADGKPITIADLFRDKAGFARVLSDKVTAALKKKFAAEIRDYNASGAFGGDFVANFINQGAGPDAAHFSNFIVRGGNLEIWFEKAQVAPPNFGIVDVSIPLSELKDSTVPSVVGLFDGNNETARPGEVPSPSPAPTAAPVPPTPGPSARVDCAVKRCLALTFDDGPTPYTETLLDTLKKSGAHATFFVVGDSIEGRVATMRRMVAEGHEIGNHTRNHPQLTRLSTDDVSSQVKDTQDAVERTIGLRPKLFRPPYGAINPGDKAVVGLPVVLWTIDPGDWTLHDPATLTSRVMQAAAPGLIVDLHDNRINTVKSMDTLVPALTQAGYTLVTVSELLAPSVPAAGVVVTHR